MPPSDQFTDISPTVSGRIPLASYVPSLIVVPIGSFCIQSIVTVIVIVTRSEWTELTRVLPRASVGLTGTQRLFLQQHPRGKRILARDGMPVVAWMRRCPDERCQHSQLVA